MTASTRCASHSLHRSLCPRWGRETKEVGGRRGRDEISIWVVSVCLWLCLCLCRGWVEPLLLIFNLFICLCMAVSVSLSVCLSLGFSASALCSVHWLRSRQRVSTSFHICAHVHTHHPIFYILLAVLCCPVLCCAVLCCALRPILVLIALHWYVSRYYDALEKEQNFEPINLEVRKINDEMNL